MTVEEFLNVVLGLPEVTQRDGHPELTGFRVRGKGFCYLNEADASIMLKSTREEQAALVAEAPTVFSPSWASGRFAWVVINLAMVAPDELTELVTEAWRLSAPKRLAATLPEPPTAHKRPSTSTTATNLPKPPRNRPTASSDHRT